MKKLLIPAIIAITILFSTTAQALTKTESNKLLISTLVTEHCRRKDCDPLQSFLIQSATFSVLEILDDNKIELNDITLSFCGYIASYSIDEIINFIGSGIKAISQE